MNVATYLMLTVPLVGGSLYVYDSLRPAAPAVAADGTPVRAAGERTSSDGADERPVLAGDPAAEIARQVRAEVARLVREGAVPASSAPATSAIAPESGPAPGAALPPLDLGDEPLAGSDGSPAQFDEKALRVFRAYLDEAQRRQNDERLTRTVNETLTQLNIALTDDQRKAVVDATLRHQRARWEAVRSAPDGASRQEERRKAVEEVNASYARTISSIVSASDAEKIVGQLGNLGRWGMEWAPQAGGGFARPRGPGVGGGSGGGGGRGDR